MKLTKFGILVNKTTSLSTSIRDSSISRGCVKILEISEGSGGGGGGKIWGPILENTAGGGWVIWPIPSVGMVWIFQIRMFRLIDLCVLPTGRMP